MAKTKPYQFRVEIPKAYSSETRQAIASEIVTFVRQRTLQGKDVDGNKFPKYTTEYMKSTNFKAAGKSKKVDLKLSGEMLSELDLVAEKKGELVIGFADDSENAGKAEGNQIGSYGKDPNPSKARRFLGINPDDLEKILRKYPEGDRQSAVNDAVSAFSEALRGKRKR